MKIVFRLLFLGSIVLMFFACNRNRLNVDISDIEKDVEVVRFGQQLFEIPLQDTLAELEQLHGKYPDFFNLFTYKIINVGGIDDEYFPELMGEFLGDTMILNVKLDVEDEFSDFDKMKKRLNTAFKYYQYHFPDMELPAIYTTVSGFNESVFTAEGIIGISLDKYLGRDYPFYKKLSNVPLYKIKNMHREKLPSDVAYAWGLTEFDEIEQTTTVLDNIIHQGKLLYLVDALLPDIHDSLKIGYTTEQIQWCENNEAEMWNYLVENKMLYSNKRMDILRYINDGPSTTGFPIESPARTGTWIGWQIVRQYMKKYEEITLPQLMANKNYQEILNESGYYPE